MRLPNGRVRRLAPAILALAGLPALMGGCPPQRPPAVNTEIAELKEESAARSRQIVALESQLRTQSRQIRELMALPADQRLASIPHVVRIELAALSGGYDEQDDGIDEGIVVYLQPIDQDGDRIKAAGTATVRLVDLANPPPEQGVGTVSLGVEQLRACWYGRISSHFTIKVPWAGGAARAHHSPITAVVSFTEHLTGRTFGAQAAFEVTGNQNPSDAP